MVNATGVQRKTMLNKEQLQKRMAYYKVPFVSTLILAGTLTVGIYTWTGIQSLVEWGATHQFVKQEVVKLAWPYRIEERKLQVVNQIDMGELKLETDIEKYICSKFDPIDCRIALAVARAESGMREDAVNINTNGTIDIGIYQINSVHFGKQGCSLKDVVDQYKNVDCAYSIWLEQGWNPWVAYTSGSYLERVEQ